MADLDKRIKKTSLVDLVAEQIKSYIKENKLIAGDKLPSESEFVAMFDVNRFTVRLALQKLSAIGLIETKVGEGSFVRDFSIAPVLAEISDAYVSSASISEIFVLRKIIELECLRLVIENASDDDIKCIRRQLDRYLNMYTTNNVETFTKTNPGFQGAVKDIDTVLEADLDFHRAICFYSRNGLLYDIFQLLCPLIKKHILSVYAEKKEAGLKITQSNDPHRDIVAALEARDWKACKRAYLLNVGSSLSLLEPSETEG